MESLNLNLGTELDWKKVDGLMPVVVQDSETLQVLMLAYMNEEALAKTLATKEVTFFSRTKKRLWTKGESSGNTLSLVAVIADCDKDALLLSAKPKGPTCHRETVSCFGDAKAPGIGFLSRLAGVIDERRLLRPEGSYVTRLLARGMGRVAQKVGEEGVEVVVAALAEDQKALTSESADLVFHLLVLLREKGISFLDVVETLRSRNEGEEKKK